MADAALNAGAVRILDVGSAQVENIYLSRPSLQRYLLKVCLLAKQYPPETGGGGIGTYTYNLAHGLAELGHQVHVISMVPGRYYHTLPSAWQDTTHWDGQIYIHRLVPGPTRWWLYYPYLGISYLARKLTGVFITRLGYSYRVSQKIQQLVRQCQIQIVESPEWEGEAFWYTLLSERPVPVVVKLHIPTFYIHELNDSKLGRDYQFVAWMERQMLLCCDQIVSCSTALAQTVADRYGISARRIRVLPNPIDVDAFVPSAETSRTDELQVLYTGRLERRKGLHILMQAVPKVVSECPNVKFILVGHDTRFGPEQTSYRQYLKDLLQPDDVEHVEFVGHRPRSELIPIYQRCAVYVMPSLFENFAGSCLEAMACGKPVVATRTGGMPEMIEEGVSGLLVQPEDPQALAEALITLLQDPLRRKEVGQAARHRVETRFSRQCVAQQTATLYQEIISAY